MLSPPPSPAPVALITGAARRVGRDISCELHRAGYRVLLHYHRSQAEAEQLARTLNTARPDSARLLHADLSQAAAIDQLAQAALASWQRLDVLVNNASSYHRSPLGDISAALFDELIATNLRAPLLLSQACAPRMADAGCIINLIDIYARKPLIGYSAYLAAKAGLWSVTECLALELAPRLRVNGIAPGHLLWASDAQLPAELKSSELARVPLQRLGGAEAVANTVRFLVSAEASYLTGAILPVDGGLRLS